MEHATAGVAEWRDVDTRTFCEEIVPRGRPAVLRGLIRHWPAVQHALRGPEAICSYLVGLDTRAPVDALMLPPEAGGRIFYSDDLAGFNYLRRRLPVSAVIEQLARYSGFAAPPAVAVQSALIADCLPGFSADNLVPVLDASVQPRIWIGNRIITPAHFDQSSNLACVVAGHRRFTLFPPEQVDNLYIGPLDHAPTPTPISMVRFAEPDFERFPRFREALAASDVVELAPGDAIYMPALWWHHVESLDELNILVNYWWGAQATAGATTGAAFAALLQHLREAAQAEGRTGPSPAH